MTTIPPRRVPCAAQAMRCLARGRRSPLLRLHRGAPLPFLPVEFDPGACWCGSATRSRSGPSGWLRQLDPLVPDRRPPNALPDRDATARHRSRLLSLQAFQTPTAASSRPTDAGRSCQCVCRRAYRHPYRSEPACHPTRDRPRSPASEVIAAPRNWSLNRRSKSSASPIRCTVRC
jgi:hypothetical protein